MNEDVAAFGASLGANLGMPGCAGIWPTLLAVFTIHLLGIEYTPVQYAFLVVLAVVVSIGTVGVPGTATITATALCLLLPVCRWKPSSCFLPSPASWIWRVPLRTLWVRLPPPPLWLLPKSSWTLPFTMVRWRRSRQKPESDIKKLFATKIQFKKRNQEKHWFAHEKANRCFFLIKERNKMKIYSLN